MADKLKQRAASDALIEEAMELVTNGDKIPADRSRKLILAIALDNRTDIIELKDGMDTINDHPFHRITPKRLLAIVSAFAVMSGIYIKESRDAVFDVLEELVILLF